MVKLGGVGVPTYRNRVVIFLYLQELVYLLTKLKACFWQFYKNLQQQDRKYYEIIQPGKIESLSSGGLSDGKGQGLFDFLKLKDFQSFLDVPVKLFLDLEFYTSLNEEKNKLEVLTSVIELVILQLDIKYCKKISMEDVLILDSSTKGKFSFHLIFPSGTDSK